MKKRRATIIVENEQGILLTRMKTEPWLLPGGMAERNEPRIIAAIRELYEETKLMATDVTFLFEHESQKYYHKVFLIKVEGTPTPSNEVTSLTYYSVNNTDLNALVQRSSLEIIQNYLSLKSGVQ